MLKLYTTGNSICTHKVFITLAEKAIRYETQKINLFGNEQFSPWYLKINPKGVVPALDHDGRIVTESTLICEYLDETFPDRSLVPSDPYLRAKMRQWSKRVDEGLFEATREISFSAIYRAKMQSMTPALREGVFRNVGDAVKRARMISTYEQGAESPYVYQGIAAFEAAFATMELELGPERSGGPWLLGSDLSLADINMMPFVARLHYLNLLDIWLADRPLARAWFDRAQALETFRISIPANISAAEFDGMSTYGTQIRDQVQAQLGRYRAEAGALLDAVLEGRENSVACA